MIWVQFTDERIVYKQDGYTCPVTHHSSCRIAWRCSHFIQTGTLYYCVVPQGLLRRVIVNFIASFRGTRLPCVHHAHTHVHATTPRRLCTHNHASIHTRARACTHTHTYTHMHTCTHAYMYMQTYMYTHIRIHARTHTRTHTHTHTHTRVDFSMGTWHIYIGLHTEQSLGLIGIFMCDTKCLLGASGFYDPIHSQTLPKYRSDSIAQQSTSGNCEARTQTWFVHTTHARLTRDLSFIGSPWIFANALETISVNALEPISSRDFQIWPIGEPCISLRRSRSTYFTIRVIDCVS